MFITFENGKEIYKSREGLAGLASRVTGLSDEPPYIAEPDSDTTYRNVLTGLKQYLSTSGTSVIGNAELGDDAWPKNYEEFVMTLKNYASISGPGNAYAQDLAFSSDGTDLEAYRVQLQYVRLTKLFRGEVLDDASRQIVAMDMTRKMVDSWSDLAPALPYSSIFISSKCCLTFRLLDPVDSLMLETESFLPLLIMSPKLRALK